MGRVFKSRFTTAFEILGLVLILVAIGTALNFIAPGLKTEASKQLNALSLDSQDIDNVTNTAMLELPTSQPSTLVINKPKVRIAGYAWNGQTPIYLANGGAITTKGSLMEKLGVNLELVRQDWLTQLSDMQLSAVEEFDTFENRTILKN